MKINIYYGGRGLLEDPTLFVIHKLTEVLQELRVDVERFNIYEEKQSVSMLPNTLKDADGIILATNVEWFGIGGYMQQFLDACWFYGDKEKIKAIYMLPVVISNTYGEKEGEYSLTKAWEILGGKVCDGICAYVKNHIDFETNEQYKALIERKAEMIYRTINQKTVSFPSSYNTVSESLIKNTTVDLTPQESEQLSIYASDDNYVKKQKEDIEELTSMFREMLGQPTSQDNQYIDDFMTHYRRDNEILVTYEIEIIEDQKTLVLEAKEGRLECYYGSMDDSDVQIKVSRDILKEIISGTMTIQRAFMTGDVVAKGNFNALKTFDSIFTF